MALRLRSCKTCQRLLPILLQMFDNIGRVGNRSIPERDSRQFPCNNRFGKGRRGCQFPISSHLYLRKDGGNVVDWIERSLQHIKQRKPCAICTTTQCGSQQLKTFFCCKDSEVLKSKYWRRKTSYYRAN